MLSKNTQVSVKDNRIGDEGKRALGQALLANHRSSIAAFDCDEWTIGLSTTSLDVSGKGLTSCDGILLAGVLKSNTSITTVRKDGRIFRAPGFENADVLVPNSILHVFPNSILCCSLAFQKTTGRRKRQSAGS